MTRVQAWLENFLTPLSKMYGDFEYTKDSSDILRDFSNLNQVAEEEGWDFNDVMLFGIDVQALYPSVKFEYLELAICDCLNKCTDWSLEVKAILLDMIIYTLENQQIFWDGKFYMLNKGIPTGGKHCVPLANIFLSYILRDLLNNNPEFRLQFETRLKLWKRYIDDCGGLFIGRDYFIGFFRILSEQFSRFELTLTLVISNERIVLLDIEIFIDDKQLHTKEHRKETASDSYVKFGSAHPKHCFKGIVKSQMNRLRRLCSRNSDFMEAIGKLRERCLNSGYDSVMVDGILAQANTLERALAPNVSDIAVDTKIVRWVILSGTMYERSILDFAKRMNRSLLDHNIKLDIVRSTGSSIAKLLFNNNVKSMGSHDCDSPNCVVCSHNSRTDSDEIVSPISGRVYPINPSLKCDNCGIYAIFCRCLSLYTGKTTQQYNFRFNEHFLASSGSAVFDHTKKCPLGKSMEDFSIQFLENMYSRGKYSLSEREYLWNERLRGILNIQKTLKR